MSVCLQKQHEQQGLQMLLRLEPKNFMAVKATLADPDCRLQRGRDCFFVHVPKTVMLDRPSSQSTATLMSDNQVLSIPVTGSQPFHPLEQADPNQFGD